MNKVFSLDDAVNWFLSNSSGTLICVKGDESKECNSFPEAKEFYK